MSEVENALKLIGMYVKGAADNIKSNGGNPMEKTKMNEIFENAKSAMKGIIHEDFLPYFKIERFSPFEYLLVFDIYMLSNEERENIVLNRTEQDRVDVGTSLYNIIEIGLIEKECGYDYDGIEYCYYPQYKMLREDSACITEVESIDDALWLLSKIRAKGYFHVSGNYDSLLDCLIEEEQNECC